MKTKNIISSIALALVADPAHAHAQGTVLFANNLLTPIIDARTGEPASAGFVTVGLYYGLTVGAMVDPGAPADEMLLLATTGIVPLPGASGLFNGGPVLLPDGVAGPGDSALMQVRVWAPGFGSYEEAFAAGTSQVAVSQPLVVTAGGAMTAPGSLVAAGFEGLTVVPEPSTWALCMLGALGAFAWARGRSLTKTR